MNPSPPPRTRLYQAVILIFSCGLVAGCSPKSTPAPASAGGKAPDPAVPITTAAVKLVPLDRTLPVVGTLFAKDESTLSAEVEGRVEQTMAEFGDRVATGQEIARIDTTTYDAQFKQSAAALEKARSTTANAERDLKRIQELRKSGISSDADLDKATSAAEESRAGSKSAEAELAITQIRLEKSHVRVPYNSAIADRIATAGDFVRVGDPLFRIVNDSVLKFICQAPERYAGDIRKEQVVNFTVDAYPTNQFEGRVYLISPQVNTANRAFAFGALVQNPGPKLRANTFARGEVIVERAVPTPMVPMDAVLNFSGITRVFVITGDTARRRDVVLGGIHDGWQEVVSGLKPGEIVATTGSSKLTDGGRVRVKEPVHEAQP